MMQFHCFYKQFKCNINCKKKHLKKPNKQQKQNKYYFTHIVLFKNAIFDYSSSTIFIKNDLHEVIRQYK